MDPRVKKVIGFIFLKSAFTSRNLTSLGLVAIFLGIYMASGGKIATLPSVQAGGNFGGIKNSGASEAVDPKPMKIDSVVDLETTEDSAIDPAAPRVQGLFGKTPASLEPVKPLKDQVVEEPIAEDLDQDSQDERLDGLLNRLEGMDPK